MDNNEYKIPSKGQRLNNKYAAPISNEGHCTGKIAKLIVLASNILLNNYCSQENNYIVANKKINKKEKVKNFSYQIIAVCKRQ